MVKLTEARKKANKKWNQNNKERVPACEAKRISERDNHSSCSVSSASGSDHACHRIF